MIIAGSIMIAWPHLSEALQVRVRLDDTTMLDGPSVTIAETVCQFDPGQSAPTRFALTVPAKVIDPRHHYSLSARAELPGTALFGTVQSYPWSLENRRSYQLELLNLT
ncbi:hypothetical protein ASD02_35395 [Ensifer sp. Root1252]|nr:hypothetical protein ASD02_35395 [Ensifer sp. Root1252]KRC67106.1 hypothetical protein ASE32_35625 [Ensifer sp. Root231]KRC93685.1 hypothetical protein ASE47_35480 [Ensifer sp. Root258]